LRACTERWTEEETLDGGAGKRLREREREGRDKGEGVVVRDITMVRI
jgi:hypothetical protein